jgi:hypothetical protein
MGGIVIEGSAALKYNSIVALSYICGANKIPIIRRFKDSNICNDSHTY